MTKRAGPYRNVKPLARMPSAHTQWVCIGCGAVEWFAWPASERRTHCAFRSWRPITDLALVGLALEVVQATVAIGGREALWALIEHAVADAQEPPDVSLWYPGQD